MRQIKQTRQYKHADILSKNRESFTQGPNFSYRLDVGSKNQNLS